MRVLTWAHVSMVEQLCLKTQCLTWASCAAVCARACVFLPARASMAEPLCLKTQRLTWASVSLPLSLRTVCARAVCVCVCELQAAWHRPT